MNVDNNLDQILCPVVPSNSSDEGLRCAIALARAHDSKLYVLNCVDELGPACLVGQEETREALEKSIERSVDLHNVNGDVRPLNWEPIIAAGQPADAITREAAERKVDLIVMSSRHRPFAAALLGSTAEMVSRTAPCPLLVVRLGSDRPANGTHGIAFKRMLVATDFSSDSELALRYGFSLAQKYQSHLHLLHVLTDSPTRGEEIDWTTRSGEGHYYEAARRLHESIPPEVHLWSEVTHAVREGQPYREILSYAAEQQIDLICIGAHGNASQSGGLFGSNADRVLRESPSPVLVLRPAKGMATDRTNRIQRELLSDVGMHDLRKKVLGMFEYLKKDVLDLHELFEAGGNDPDARAAVVDTVAGLVKEELLEERGSDFYALTAQGERERADRTKPLT